MWQIAQRDCYAVMGFDALGVVAYTTGTTPSVMVGLVAGDHFSTDLPED